MAISNSYAKLPEGTSRFRKILCWQVRLARTTILFRARRRVQVVFRRPASVEQGGCPGDVSKLCSKITVLLSIMYRCRCIRVFVLFTFSFHCAMLFSVLVLAVLRPTPPKTIPCSTLVFAICEVANVQQRNIETITPTTVTIDQSGQWSPGSI